MPAPCPCPLPAKAKPPFAADTSKASEGSAEKPSRWRSSVAARATVRPPASISTRSARPVAVRATTRTAAAALARREVGQVAPDGREPRLGAPAAGGVEVRLDGVHPGDEHLARG